MNHCSVKMIPVFKEFMIIAHELNMRHSYVVELIRSKDLVQFKSLNISATTL